MDWKTIKPTAHLSKEVAKFEPYLQEKEQLIRVPRAVEREYKEAGYKTKGGAILLPKEEERRTVYNPETRHLETIEQQGHVLSRYKRLKYGPQDAHKFIRDAEAGKFDDYKGLWAFYYYGNKSLTSYNSLKELAAELAKYSTLNAEPEEGEGEGEGLVPQFNLVQWGYDYDYRGETGRRPGSMDRTGRTAGKKGHKRKRSSTPYRHKMKRENPAAYQRLLDEDASRKRANRDKPGMSADIARAKDAARKRAEREK